MALWVQLINLIVGPATLVPSALGDIPLGLWTVLGGSMAVGAASAAREGWKKVRG